MSASQHLSSSSRLRLATPEDAAGILAIYGPIVEETAISFESMPPPVSEMEKRILEAQTVAPWIVCDRKSEIVGYAYAQPHRGRAAYRWSVESSVFVHADARRHGIGRGLYGTLLRLLRLQGFRRCFAGITLRNDPSVALHEALGFEHLGVFRRVGYKHGKWHDVGWWQTDLHADDGDPQRPTTLADLSSRGHNVAGMSIRDLESILARG